MPKNKAFERAAALLEMALAKRPRTQERARALVREIEENRHDKRRLPEAGRALEALRRGKAYKALGFDTYEELLTSIGLSRSHAFRWRKLAAEAGVAREDGGMERVAAEAQAARLRKDLEAHGVTGRVSVVREAEGIAVRVELSPESAGRLRVK